MAYSWVCDINISSSNKTVRQVSLFNYGYRHQSGSILVINLAKFYRSLNIEAALTGHIVRSSLSHHYISAVREAMVDRPQDVEVAEHAGQEPGGSPSTQVRKARSIHTVTDRMTRTEEVDYDSDSS
ncbi:hypothetical protein J6590_053214 [Homalodisca vitripennis]|nr:hypothetical protein J6590_053214 [Homalodisca vitripennis]